MIPGFNLDIRYKGKTFHIQTEDSGPGNPVIMTHLFIFGTILGSRKLDYADLVGQPDMVERVREHMRAELRAMHAALLAGDVLHGLGLLLQAADGKAQGPAHRGPHAAARAGRRPARRGPRAPLFAERHPPRRRAHARPPRDRGVRDRPCLGAALRRRLARVAP